MRNFTPPSWLPERDGYKHGKWYMCKLADGRQVYARTENVGNQWPTVAYTKEGGREFIDGIMRTMEPEYI
jgi:hypothetical protein